MINDFNSAEIKIFSITEINKLVKELLQDNFPSIWVKGVARVTGTSLLKIIAHKFDVLCLEEKIMK